MSYLTDTNNFYMMGDPSRVGWGMQRISWFYTPPEEYWSDVPDEYIDFTI